MRIVWITVNFGRDDSKKHHETNIRRVGEFAQKQENVICLTQEIGEGDHGYNEPAMLHRHFPGFRWVAGHSMTPILVKGFDIEHESIEKASDGIAHIWPSRYVVKARLRHNKFVLVVENLHPDQGAFTDPGQNLEHLRDVNYQKVWDMAKRKGQRALNQQHTVAWGGDMNNPNPAIMFSGEKTLVHRSLDIIRVAERDTAVQLLHTGAIEMSIDGHNAPFAVTKIT